MLFGIHGDVDRGTELRCMAFTSGEVRWSTDELRPGGLSAAGNRLIVLTDEGDLAIVSASAESAEILARHRVLEGKCWTAPVLSSGRIYCRSVEGALVGVDVR